MRTEIFDGLPKVLPRDKIVLIVGHENIPGLKTMQSLISDLNRRDEWVKAEFRRVPKSVVSAKVGVILFLYGTSEDCAASIRRAAGGSGICIPNGSLTVGEAKLALRKLSEARKVETGEIKAPLAVAAREPEPSEFEYEEGPEYDEAMFDETPISDEEPSSEVGSEPVPAPDELDQAFVSLDEFGVAFKKAQDSVFVIAERYQAAAAEVERLKTKLANANANEAEVDALKTQLAAATARSAEFEQVKRELAEKDAQVSDLVSRLAKAQAVSVENGKLSAKVRELEAENSRLAAEGERLGEELGKFKSILEGIQSLSGKMLSK